MTTALAFTTAAELLIANTAAGLHRRPMRKELAAAARTLDIPVAVFPATRGFRVYAGEGHAVTCQNLSEVAGIMLAHMPQPAPAPAPSPLQRLAEWAKGLSLQELRWDAVGALLDAGVPALSLVPLQRLPLLIGGAEYALKTPWIEAPLAVLAAAEDDARRWLD
jgi:hypothetical protein